MSKHSDSVPAGNRDVQSTLQPRVAPKILHHFRVNYGGDSILTAGQVLPVWDVSKWTSNSPMINSFTATAVTAVQIDGIKLRTNTSYDANIQAAIEAYADSDSTDPNASMPRAVLQVAKLGNVGGLRIVRPDPKPIGVMPFELMYGPDGLRLWDCRALSVLDWVQEVATQSEDRTMTRMVPIIAGSVPRMEFFIESPDGAYEGFDVAGMSRRKLRRIPLPFSWSAPHEKAMGLVPAGQDICQQATAEGELWNNMAAGARTMFTGETGFWPYPAKGGKVYFGWNVPTAKSYIIEERVSLDRFYSDFLTFGMIHEMPWIEGDPMGILNGPAIAYTERLRCRIPTVSRGRISAPIQKQASKKPSTHLELIS